MSVLWKADVYRDAADQECALSQSLSIPDVVDRFNRDLAAKGTDIRLDVDQLEDPNIAAAMYGLYPEAVPQGKRVSMFDQA